MTANEYQEWLNWRQWYLPTYGAWYQPPYNQVYVQQEHDDLAEAYQVALAQAVEDEAHWQKLARKMVIYTAELETRLAARNAPPARSGSLAGLERRVAWLERQVAPEHIEPGERVAC